MTGSILVTGSRGFIGSVVMRHLRSKGYAVIALPGDVRGELPAADVIVHCAGRKNDEPDSYDVNVNGARNLLRTGAKIINVSTVSTLLPERGLYGDTKLEADTLLRDQVTLKLGLVYGDGAILRTLINWTRLPVVPFYGNAVFRPVYVEDVAQIIEQALTWQPGVYQIGGPDAVTLRELIQKVAVTFHHKRVLTIPLPRFLARLYLTRSNILGAEQTVPFPKQYGRSLDEGLTDTWNRMSR